MRDTFSWHMKHSKKCKTFALLEEFILSNALLEEFIPSNPTGT
jgi:hypothetical protein